MLRSLRRDSGSVAVHTSGSRARRPRRHLQAEALEARTVLSTLGPEFVVNTKTDGVQTWGDNASSANGMSVAVWIDKFSSNDGDVRAQLYDAAHQALGPEIIVDFSTADDKESTVAMDADGDFVVTWTRVLPGGDNDVMARRYSRTGAPLGDAFAVANGPKAEYRPDVAMDADGDFVVTYSYAYSGTDHDIYAKRYSGGGALLQTIGVATTTKMERYSHVAMAPDGRFDIVYKYEYSGTDDDVYLNRYSSGGALLGSHAIAASSDDELIGSVSMDDAGNAVVAYSRFVGGDYDVKARRVSNAGVVGAEINIRSTARDETSPTVALSRTGGAFVVAYRDSFSGIRVATVSASNEVTDDFDASSPESDNQSNTSISIDGSGRFLVTYSSQDKVPFGNHNIRSRFGQL